MKLEIDTLIDILAHPMDHEWTVQGLGMMRTYLSDKSRLHIWHSALQTPDVSMVHDHPWHFTSEILLGKVYQYRYVRDNAFGTPWQEQQIVCGTGGGMVGDPTTINLRKCEKEVYTEGDTYEQKAHELHVSYPLDNTVTVITREYLEDLEHARVFFPLSMEFVSAEPRPATRAEVLFITREVLHSYQEKNNVC
jgi:hypothetical protein